MTFKKSLMVGFAVLFLTSCKLLENVHTVEKNQLYRSAQLDGKALEALVKERGIKTIINLRGAKPGNKDYDDEVAVAKRNNILLVDIGMSASRLPHKQDLITLLEAFKNSPRPILVHCAAGVDRTGEAAALWQMIYMGKTREESLKMLTIKYGHIEKKFPAKRYFIREVWQGVEWAYQDYDPCSGEYEHYDVNSEACQSDGSVDDPVGDT